MNTPHGNHPSESLSAYLDGALDPKEREEVERHLAECAACARTLEALRTLASDFRGEAVPEVPEGLEARVRAALDGEAKVVPFAPRRRWAIPATMAATLGALALLAVAVRMGVVETPAPREVAKDEAVERVVDIPPPPPPTKAAPEPLGEDRAIEEGGRKKKEADDDARLRSMGYVGPPEAKREEAAQVPSEDPRAKSEFARALEPEPTPAAPAPAPRRDASLEKVAMDEAAPSGGVAGDRAEGFQKSVVLPSARATCRTPFDVGLGRVVWAPPLGTDPDRDLAAAARRHGGEVHGRIEGPEPLTAVEVSAARWPALRDELRAAGVEGLADLPEPSPSADCVRVWITIRPGPATEPR